VEGASGSSSKLFRIKININDKRTTNAAVAVAIAVFSESPMVKQSMQHMYTKKILVKSSQFSKRKVLDYCPRTGFRTGMKL
jgi:hypothetical protein